MAILGKNMVDLRVSNRVAILRLLYAKGGMSRKDIAASLQLTAASISQITGDLVSEGVLSETKSVSGSSNMGRKEVILEINLTRFRVLCAYVPTREVRICCVDLAGNTYFSKDLNFADSCSGAQIVQSICKEFKQYTDSLPAEQRATIVGMGLGIKGIFDNVRGVSVNSFGLWEHELAVGELVSKQFPIRILGENNIRCVATAEMMFNQDESLQSMLFVKLGPLIGGAMIVDNSIFRGFGYKAMELGHFVVDPLGFVCRCGKRGCLETIMGFDVIADNLALQYSPERMPVLYQLTAGDKSKITMELIIKSFEGGDRVTGDILDVALERFAFMIVNVSSMVDPQKVILYGFPFESEKFLSLLQAKVDKLCVGGSQPLIEKSCRNLQLEELGCMSIVLEDFLNNGAIYTQLP